MDESIRYSFRRWLIMRKEEEKRRRRRRRKGHEIAGKRGRLCPGCRVDQIFLQEVSGIE